MGFNQPVVFGNTDILHVGKMMGMSWYIISDTMDVSESGVYHPSGKGSKAMTFPGVHPKIAANSEWSSPQVEYFIGIEGNDPSYLHQIVVTMNPHESPC